MSSFSQMNLFFAGALLLITFLSLGQLRLRAFVRFFAIASFFLACLIFSIVIERGIIHEYAAVAATLIFKVWFIPYLIRRTASKAGISNQLKAYLRSEIVYFLGAGLLLGVALMTKVLILNGIVSTTISPIFFSGLLFVAIALIFLGLLLLVIRKDIYSQIIGLLTIENGIAVFGITAVGGTPFLVEMGIFFVIVMSVIVMTMLSHQVYDVYGTTDTVKLSELIN